MKRIRTIKFEAKPVGNTMKTAENLSGKDSNDRKRYVEYEDTRKILDAYVSVIVRNSLQGILNNKEVKSILQTPGKITKEEEQNLKYMIREEMMHAAKAANLSEGSCRLFGKQTPVAEKLGNECIAQLTLYRGFGHFFSFYLARIVKTMVSTGSKGIPYAFTQNIIQYKKEKNRFTGREVLFNDIPLIIKPEAKKSGQDYENFAKKIATWMAFRTLEYEDYHQLYIKASYVDFYKLYGDNEERTSLSGSICVKDTPAAEQIRKELELWKTEFSKDSSFQRVADFVSWANRFDEKIALAPWYTEFLYLKQEYPNKLYESNPMKKAQEKVTYRVFFNRPSLLRSLDSDLFQKGKSCSCLLEREGKYYLFLLNPDVKCVLEKEAYGKGFRMLRYKQIRNPDRLFVRIFVKEQYHPPERILTIVKNRSFMKNKKDQVLWISHCIRCLYNSPEFDIYNLKFKTPDEYISLREFYDDVEKQTIYMGYDYEIAVSYVEKAVKIGAACLFELYCMDFSDHHHGKLGKNAAMLVRTMSDTNMDMVRNGKEGGVRILGGTCRLYVREKQLEPEQYPADTPFMCKSGNVRKLPYPVIKKKRYTQKKYLFTMAVEE